MFKVTHVVNLLHFVFTFSGFLPQVHHLLHKALLGMSIQQMFREIGALLLTENTHVFLIENSSPILVAGPLNIHFILLRFFPIIQ